MTTPAADIPMVRVRDLQKQFRRRDGSRVAAIDGVDLDVAPGEFVVLLGPSGCGKTSLLRAIAGLESPDAGEIRIRDADVYSSARGISLPAQKRNISMVFQSYGLWPHMTVRKNVEFPLRTGPSRGRPTRAEIRRRVDRVLELVGIAELANQYPSQMSGGQQQRVAVARAIVGGSDIVLFDEPLSNVDAKVREQLRAGLLDMQRELGFAAIYVTHDQVEAMELADRVAVMRAGHVEQLGSPRDVYERPVNRYVGNFMGVMNQAPGTVVELQPDDLVTIDTGFGLMTGIGRDLAVGDSAVAMWRPERATLEAAPRHSQPNFFGARVLSGTFMGAHVEHVLRTGTHTIRVWTTGGEPGSQGTDVFWQVATDGVMIVADA